MSKRLSNIVVLCVGLEGSVITAYKDRHVAITFADRRRFVSRADLFTLEQLRDEALEVRLLEMLQVALADCKHCGRPYGYRYARKADPKIVKARAIKPREASETHPRAVGELVTNRRPVVVAALDTVRGYQILSAGENDDGTYLDVRLGLARPIRIHLNGLTAVELEELSK